MVDIELRRATTTDALDVTEIYVSSWNEGFAGLMPRRTMRADLVSRWERDLADPRLRWWLAHGDDGVVGFVGTGSSRDPVDAGLGELDTIAVAPVAWRRGVGSRLMRAAVDDLVERDFREAIVWTPADYRPGHAFYESAGWHQTGEARDAARQVAFRRSLP